MVVFLAFSRKSSIESGDFNRTLNNSVIRNGQAISLPAGSYYIAGATDDNTYIVNNNNPLAVISIGHRNKNVQSTFKFTTTEVSQGLNISLRIDSPHAYAIDATNNEILKGTLTDKNLHPFMSNNTAFADAVPISENSFIIRTFKDKKKEHVLAKRTTYEPYLRKVDNILQKQIDGIFCTDGMLLYNDSLKSLIYIYFYRNEFIYTDSNLNVQYRGHTLDSISKAKIKIGEIKSQGSITLTSPALIVNKKSITHNNWLFINSNILAKNENPSDFKQNSVIDVYDLSRGNYRFSFYIPPFNKHLVSEFRVSKNKLVALYENVIVLYDLRLSDQ